MNRTIELDHQPAEMPYAIRANWRVTVGLGLVLIPFFFLISIIAQLVGDWFDGPAIFRVRFSYDIGMAIWLSAVSTLSNWYSVHKTTWVITPQGVEERRGEKVSSSIDWSDVVSVRRRPLAIRLRATDDRSIVMKYLSREQIAEVYTQIAEEVESRGGRL